MLVLPADHLIKYEDMYIDTLKQAIKVAEEGKNLVTIGITPSIQKHMVILNLLSIRMTKGRFMR